MDTKRLGNIGESVAIAKFVKYGVPVYIPFGDDEKADLVVDFNGRLNKIQVKTSEKAANGKMVFDLTSSTKHRSNGERHKYTSNEVDYFFCYNIEREKAFLVKVPDKPLSEITIRYEAPKNGQSKNINLECNLCFENVIKTILN